VLSRVWHRGTVLHAKDPNSHAMPISIPRNIVKTPQPGAPCGSYPGAVRYLKIGVRYSLSYTKHCIASLKLYLLSYLILSFVFHPTSPHFNFQKKKFCFAPHLTVTCLRYSGSRWCMIPQASKVFPRVVLHVWCGTRMFDVWTQGWLAYDVALFGSRGSPLLGSGALGSC